MSDFIPLGVYNGELICTGQSPLEEYSVFKLHEPLAEYEQVADNWLFSIGKGQGIVVNDSVYIGVDCQGYSALDKLNLKEDEEMDMEEIETNLMISHYELLANYNEEHDEYGRWFVGLPYGKENSAFHWHGLSKEQFVVKLITERPTKEQTPLFYLGRYS